MTTVDLTAEQLETLDAALDKAAGQSGCYRHVIAAVELIATEHRASERGVIAERLRLSAVDRFDEYGPHDDRGAAFWDAACWLNEDLRSEPRPQEGSETDG